MCQSVDDTGNVALSKWIVVYIVPCCCFCLRSLFLMLFMLFVVVIFVHVLCFYCSLCRSLWLFFMLSFVVAYVIDFYFLFEASLLLMLSL